MAYAINAVRRCSLGSWMRRCASRSRQRRKISFGRRWGYEIDAKITVDGKTEKLESVKQLEFLPGNKTPVLQFLKGDFEQKSAAFVVSPRVTETRGEGKCSPNNSSCEFLLLKDGESHSFDYEPDGRTYRIRLTRVKRIDTRVDPDDVAGEELRNSAGSLSGLLAIR
jgi:hypothetical protein